MKKEATIGLVFIYTMNAVLWMINLLLHDETSSKSLWLKIMCVVLWTAAALLSFLGYRKNKRKEQT